MDETKPANQQDFDLEEVYDEQIAPLMDKIIEICKEHKLPMACTFMFSGEVDAEDGAFCTTLLPFDEDRYLTPRMKMIHEIMTPADRPPTLYITLTKADGSKEITAVMG